MNDENTNKLAAILMSAFVGAIVIPMSAKIVFGKQIFGKTLEKRKKGAAMAMGIGAAIGAIGGWKIEKNRQASLNPN